MSLAQGLLASSISRGESAGGAAQQVIPKPEGRIRHRPWGGQSLARGWGADCFRGFAGADTLDGGAGEDTMDGGAGADVFLLRPGEGAT